MRDRRARNLLSPSLSLPQERHEAEEGVFPAVVKAMTATGPEEDSAVELAGCRWSRDYLYLFIHIHILPFAPTLTGLGFGVRGGV